MTKLLLSLLFSLAAIFSSCQATTGGVELPVAAFEQKLAVTPNIQLIDVRSEEEYKTGHLKGAENMDWDDSSFPAQASRLDKNKPVFVYCLSGVRSSKAAGKLTDMGFMQVYKLKGGIKAWQEAGKPVEK